MSSPANPRVVPSGLIPVRFVHFQVRAPQEDDLVRPVPDPLARQRQGRVHRHRNFGHQDGVQLDRHVYGVPRVLGTVRTTGGSKIYREITMRRVHFVSGTIVLQLF